MNIKSINVQDTNRNAIKEVIVAFDKKPLNFKNEEDLHDFLSEIKAGISKQLPRFEDPSGDGDWSIFERIEGQEMLDEWGLSIQSPHSWNDYDESYEGPDAYEIIFELDIIEVNA